MSPGELRFDSWPKEGTYIVYLVKAPGDLCSEPSWVCDVMSVNVVKERVHVIPDALYTECHLRSLCLRPY